MSDPPHPPRVAVKPERPRQPAQTVTPRNMTWATTARHALTESPPPPQDVDGIPPS